MDGRQMKMVSEQRTELGGMAEKVSVIRRFSARLRWVRPLQRRSTDWYSLRSVSVRVGRKEVVTRFIPVFLVAGRRIFLCFCEAFGDRSFFSLGHTAC